MGTCAFYGILVLCICFIQTFGYERCTYGTRYYYCNTGSCCKINGVWKCTSIDLSISECNSLSETTTRRTTTRWTTTTTNTTETTTSSSQVPVYAAVAGFVVVAFVVMVIVGAIQSKRKQSNTPSSPVVRSTTIAIIYKA